MEIKVEKPPNFEDIAAVFPMVRTQTGILYCWNHYIYNPDDVKLTAPLISHEEIHSDQQDGQPEDWWKKYLNDNVFRFHQELEAHRAEYQRFYVGSDIRNERRQYLKFCAKRLSGPLYGNCVTFEKAVKMIKEREE